MFKIQNFGFLNDQFYFKEHQWGELFYVGNLDFEILSFCLSKVSNTLFSYNSVIQIKSQGGIAGSLIKILTEFMMAIIIGQGQAIRFAVLVK